MNQKRIQELVALQQERTAKLANMRTAQIDFRIENKGTTSEIYLYDEVAPWAITAQDFVTELNQIPENNSIDLHINSPGGGVFDGLAIYNAMKRRKGPVRSYVDGVAASTASFIAMAGSEVIMARNSTMMIHDAHGIAIGNAVDMRELADLLDMISNQIADIYAQKAGGTVEEWRALMSNDKWFTAQEAKDANLADVVVNEDKSTPSDTYDFATLLTDIFSVSHPTNNLSTPALDIDGLRDALKGVFQ